MKFASDQEFNPGFNMCQAVTYNFRNRKILVARRAQPEPRTFLGSFFLIY